MVTPDPADRLDAQADGAFGARVHRGGYSDIAWILRYARKGATLGAGEGARIVEHYEAQLAALGSVLAFALRDRAHPTLESRRKLHDVAASVHVALSDTPTYTSETPSTGV